MRLCCGDERNLSEEDCAGTPRLRSVVRQAEADDQWPQADQPAPTDRLSGQRQTLENQR